MDDKQREAEWHAANRHQIIAGEALEVRAKKLPIKLKLELLRRANAGESYKDVLEELEAGL